MTEEDKQARNWGMLCHLTSLSLYIGVPFGNILGPLLVWLLKRDEISAVNTQGKESLNFQITMTLYSLVAGILCFIVIGIPLLIGLFVAHVVLTIVATIKINNGEEYRYPFTYRFIN